MSQSPALQWARVDAQAPHTQSRQSDHRQTITARSCSQFIQATIDRPVHEPSHQRKAGHAEWMPTVRANEARATATGGRLQFECPLHEIQAMPASKIAGASDPARHCYRAAAGALSWLDRDRNNDQKVGDDRADFPSHFPWAIFPRRSRPTCQPTPRCAFVVRLGVYCWRYLGGQQPLGRRAATTVPKRKKKRAIMK